MTFRFPAASLNPKETLQRWFVWCVFTPRRAPERETNDFHSSFNHACARLGVQAILPLHCFNERWIISVVALNTHPYQLCLMTNGNLCLWYLEGDECGLKWMVSCQNKMHTLFEKVRLHPKVVPRMKGECSKHSSNFLCQQNYWTMSSWQLYAPSVMTPLYLSHPINLSHTLVRFLMLFAKVHSLHTILRTILGNILNAQKACYKNFVMWSRVLVFLSFKNNPNRCTLITEKDRKKQYANPEILPGKGFLSQQSLVNIPTAVHK